MSHTTEPDHDRVVRIETKLDVMCKTITKTNEGVEKLREIVDEGLKAQREVCMKQINCNGKELSNKPSFALFTWMIGILVVAIIGAYGYTNDVSKYFEGRADKQETRIVKIENNIQKNHISTTNPGVPIAKPGG